MWTCKPEKADAIATARTINTDAYGAATIAYMDRWGGMMEDIVNAEGIDALTPERVEQTGRDADTDGITGYMHGWARSALRECWVHGSALNRKPAP